MAGAETASWKTRIIPAYLVGDRASTIRPGAEQEDLLVRIKGTSITSLLAFLEAEYGPGPTRDFLATLDPALKKRCEGLILASAFYPVEDLEALATRARAHFRGDSSFYERSGAFNASFGLSGVHKALLSRPNPLDFLRAAERAWSQFIDQGSVEANLVGDGKVRLRVDGLPGSEVRCQRSTGFLLRSLGLAGAQKLSVVKVHCTQSGDTFCEWNLAWDPVLSPPSTTLTSAIRRPTVV